MEYCQSNFNSHLDFLQYLPITHTGLDSLNFIMEWRESTKSSHKIHIKQIDITVCGNANNGLGMFACKIPTGCGHLSFTKIKWHNLGVIGNRKGFLMKMQVLSNQLLRGGKPFFVRIKIISINEYYSRIEQLEKT